MAEPIQEEKLTPEQFVKRAIVSLRNDPFHGIHSVFSGFNDAFAAYFNEDPIEWVNKLASAGIIETRRAYEGLMLYLPGEAPAHEVKGVTIGEQIKWRIINRADWIFCILLGGFILSFLSDSRAAEDLRIIYFLSFIAVGMFCACAWIVRKIKGRRKAS